MKKILIITYYWPPSGGPGVQRCVKIAKYLPAYGYEPIIVTVDPEKASYPLIDSSLVNDLSGDLNVYKTNTSEPFKIYSRIIPGAKLPTPGFANENRKGVFNKLAKLIRGNLFIPDARKGWNKYALQQCRKIIQKEKISLILTSSPPHSTQLMAMQLSKESGIPWIADLRDPWTDIYYNRHLYRLSFAIRKDSRLEKRVLENADAITTVSEALKELFSSKSNKIDVGKIFVIPNGFDASDFHDHIKYTDNYFSITYTGTMSDDYPIGAFIKAMESLLENNENCNIRINIVGQITDNVLNQLRQSKIAHLMNIHGYMSHTESISMMQKTTVLLLIIPNAPNNEGIVTGKLFEYLAARRPILCFGPPNGDASKIIAKCNSGIAFGYNHADQAAAWLSNLLIQWKHGSELRVGNSYVSDYSRQKQTQYLAQIISELVG